MADHDGGGWRNLAARDRLRAVAVVVLIGIAAFAAGTHDVAAMGTDLGFLAVYLGFGIDWRPDR